MVACRNIDFALKRRLMALMLLHRASDPGSKRPLI
jgi:hypothetical protein